MKVTKSPNSSASSDWLFYEYAETDGDGASSYLIVTAGTLNGYKTHNDFNFDIPSNATITGIELIQDVWDSSCTRDNWRGRLSWDNGTNYTSSNSIVNQITNTETARTLGSATDTWGRTWTPTEINSTNFRIENGLASANQCIADSYFYDDWTRVRITYNTSSTPATTEQTFFYSVWYNAGQDNAFSLMLFSITFLGIVYLLKSKKKK